MRNLLTVARYEFSTNARRWEFLLVTLGLPLLTVALILLASVPNYMYLRARQAETRNVHVGVVDPSQTLKFPPSFSPHDAGDEPSARLPKSTRIDTHVLDAAHTWTIDTFSDPTRGREALLAHTIDTLYVFDKDYAANGKVDVITLRRNPFDVTPPPPMATMLREILLKGKVADTLMARVRLPMVANTILLDDKGRRVMDPVTDELASVAFPYAMMVLLMMALLGSSTYILRGLAEEKESRVQEVLLSSVRPSELFYGKLLGLGLLGLLQVTVWLVLALPFAVGFLRAVEVPASLIVIFFVYFVLGYMEYGAIIAGIGAIGSTEKESSQIFAIFVLLFSSPLMFIPILLDSPHGALMRFFSLFPFTSPLIMVLRAVNHAMDLPDLLISLTLLLATVWAAMRLSLKIFKLGLLLYGKSPTPTEIWKAMWSPAR